jgi:hypothetical protein
MARKLFLFMDSLCLVSLVSRSWRGEEVFLDYEEAEIEKV